MKRCEICGEPFSPIKENHRICVNCYYSDDRESYCKECGAEINNGKHYEYCYSCYMKLYGNQQNDKKE
jgi:hypothetical protein